MKTFDLSGITNDALMTETLVKSLNLMIGSDQYDDAEVIHRALAGIFRVLGELETRCRDVTQ